MARGRRGTKNKYVYHAGGSLRRRKRRGPSPWLVVALVLLLGLGLFALWFFLLRGAPAERQPEPVTTLPSLAQITEPPPASSQTPEPEPDPEPEPENTGPLELSFTAEEIAALDDMLSEWAEAVTAPVGEEGAEEGEKDGGDGEGESAETEGDAASSKVVFTPETYGHKVSVFFKDLDSGLAYSYNEGQSYEIASLSKAPYAMYLYTLAGQGELDLDETITVTAEMLAASAENSGRLKDDESLPRDMSVEELLYEALRYSDTGALRILLGRYPADGYNAWATSNLPLHHPENVKSVTNGLVTADDAAVYMEAIYQFMESAEYGPRLKEHLTNTRNLMITSNYTVARKYGWDTYSLHDMAVVYAEHPYVLVVLTDKSYGTWGEQAMFGTIAATLENMVAQKYAAGEA